MTAQTPEKTKKIVLPNLNTILKIMIALVLVTTVLTNLMVVYILFAPDELPKPFYVEYQNSGQPQQQMEPAAQQMQMPQMPAQTSAGESKNSGEPISTVLRQGEGIMIDTGTKIVNLAEPGGRTFIRINVKLEFAPSDLRYFSMTAEEKTAYLEKFRQDVATREPIIQDIIISLLSTKDFQTLYTAAGKEQLREEIKQEINARLSGFHVMYVYYNEFVVQQ